MDPRVARRWVQVRIWSWRSAFAFARVEFGGGPVLFVGGGVLVGLVS